MLDGMSRYFTVLVFLSILPPLLLAVGAAECSEKEPILRPLPRPVSELIKGLTECLMECTGMTYHKKVLLQHNQNIRLTDATEGDLEEYCWSTELKCTIGESFEHACVVLPVNLTAVGPDQLEVKVTAPAAATLHADSSPTTLAENCGLRYDVREHFSTGKAGTSLCIQVVTQEDAPVLRCPPYLATFWQRDLN